ncbi:hypothetical protein FRB94_002668 [Tulasnella sp. JGI-2019a]|nr:hypothetical protein FRB94_002668 [Tulasnella sp. JGI-2019a]
MESLCIVWASSAASHGHFLVPQEHGKKDPWDFAHPVNLFVKKGTDVLYWSYRGQITLLEEPLPDLDNDETLGLSDKRPPRS